MPDAAMKLAAILRHLEKSGGSLGISYRTEWTVAYEFGAESWDSPMVAGASYGFGDTLGEAVDTVVGELRISLAEDDADAF